MQTRNSNSDGYYGADGEFYPSSSAKQNSSNSYTKGVDGELYPRRPEINYTTDAYPGTNPPAVAGNNTAANMQGNYNQAANAPSYTGPTKFCKYCGQKIPEQAVICTHCGCQVEEFKAAAASPVVVNNNVNTNAVAYAQPMHHGTPKNKIVALLLCLFGGVLGLHRFYEGKILSGLLYLFTLGLGGIGVFIDLIIILTKPNPYYTD